MPKLNATQAKAVEKVVPVTTSGFEPHPEGWYIAKLADVEAKASAAGNPMWSVEWDNLRDLEGNELPGKQFFNLNFPSKLKADWKADDPKREERWAKYQERCKGQIHGFFLAHGSSVDSDTDEMLGEDCLIHLVIKTQQQGKRAGQLQNEVDGFKPVDEAELGEGATADAQDDPDEF
jgi:hypothetical protein